MKLYRVAGLYFDGQSVRVGTVMDFGHRQDADECARSVATYFWSPTQETDLVVPSGKGAAWVMEVEAYGCPGCRMGTCTEAQPATASCGGHASACWGDPPSDHLTAMMIHDLNMRTCGANYEKAQPSDHELSRMMLKELDVGVGVIRLG